MKSTRIKHGQCNSFDDDNTIIFVLIIITSRLTSFFFLLFFDKVSHQSQPTHNYVRGRKYKNFTIILSYLIQEEGDVDMSLYFVPHIHLRKLQQPPLNVIIISLTHSYCDYSHTNKKKNSYKYFFHINIFALSELIRESHIRWSPFLFTLTLLNLRNFA